jgi:hypothetical protein
VALLAAALGYKLLNHTTANSGAGSGAGPTSTTTATVAPSRPGAVVQAYFAAIDHHNYRLAWHLGGKNTGDTFRQYRLGFVGTAHDTVRILRQSGDTATAKIIARQDDGSRKVFQGTYTVVNGAIVDSRVHQVFPLRR